MVLRLVFIFILSFVCSSEALSSTFSFKDDGGHIVKVNKSPSRIISLYSGHSENILFLGAGDKLVAVSQADDPLLFPDLPRLPRRIDPEVIIALKPDMLIIRPMVEKFHGKAIATLRRLGVVICSLDPPSWSEIDEYTKKLSIATGIDKNIAVDKVHRMIDSLDDDRKSISSGKTFFIESMEKGLRTCSPGSWPDQVLTLAGGYNGAKDALPLREGSAIASYGLEKTLALISEGLDFYVVQNGPMNKVDYSEVMARPWSSALSKTKVIVVEERDISRPSLFRLKGSVNRLKGLMYSDDL